MSVEERRTYKRVQYVTFSKDVSFFRWKINSVNYKKHSGEYMQTLPQSWTGTQEEKSKFVDATTRLSLWIFYADRPVNIFDVTLSLTEFLVTDWYIFSTQSLDIMMLLITILFYGERPLNSHSGSLLRNFALNCLKLLW